MTMGIVVPIIHVELHLHPQNSTLSFEVVLPNEVMESAPLQKTSGFFSLQLTNLVPIPLAMWVLIVVLLITFIAYSIFKLRTSLPQLNGQHFSIGGELHSTTDLEAMQRHISQRGKTFRIWTGLAFWIMSGMKELVIISDPNVAALVLKGSDKGDSIMAKEEKGKETLATASGAYWKELRKREEPAFRGTAVRKFAAAMEIEAESSLTAASSKEGVIDLGKVFSTCALNIIGVTAFGHSFDNQEGTEMRELVHQAFRLNQQVFQTPWRFFSIKKQRDEVKARQLAIAHVIAEERKHNPTEKADLLTHLVHSLESETLSREMNMFLGVGHETTAKTLSWVAFNLIKHPGDLQKARESDEYLKWCINESMRLNNVVPEGPGRKLDNNIILPSGTIIPQGAQVFLNTMMIHRDQEVWGQDADHWRPERFEQGLPKVGWMAFSTGPRRCLGKNFAEVESFVIAKHLIQHYDFCLPQGVTASDIEKAMMGVAGPVCVRGVYKDHELPVILTKLPSRTQ